MKKLFIATFLITPVILIAQTDSTGNILQEGTIIKAALTQNISGKEVSVGQTVDFELSENVILNDKVVIPKGAKITGSVTEAQRSRALEKKVSWPSVLTISI